MLLCDKCNAGGHVSGFLDMRGQGNNSTESCRFVGKKERKGEREEKEIN